MNTVELKFLAAAGLLTQDNTAASTGIKKHSHLRDISYQTVTTPLTVLLLKLESSAVSLAAEKAKFSRANFSGGRALRAGFTRRMTCPSEKARRDVLLF